MLHNPVSVIAPLTSATTKAPEISGGGVGWDGHKFEVSLLRSRLIAVLVSTCFLKVRSCPSFQSRHLGRHFNQEFQRLIGSHLLPSFLLPAPGVTKVITARPLARPRDSCMRTRTHTHIQTITVQNRLTVPGT